MKLAFGCSASVLRSQLRSLSVCSTFLKWVSPVGFRSPVIVYNTITNSKVPLVLKNQEFITWYACGPTVYDSAHIGHASCYVKFDIIRRILSNHFGMNIVMVMGITDVDDKIIKQAALHGVDIQVLTRHYEHEFFENMLQLNVQKPTVTARVTDYMPRIISFVEKLIDKGFGYVVSDGSVYFDIRRLPTYGKFSNGVSDEVEDTSHTVEKKCPQDFALWKGAKPNESSWQTRWGKGRPGWHIECSAMASFLLGNNIDIHSGGIDLKFPHHENEEAQCCAFYDIPQWANYWLHAGHLHLKDAEKMSKSLKNTISISDFLKLYSSNEFRIFCLLSHYRSGVEYTESSMQKAQALAKKITSFVVDCDAAISGMKGMATIDEPKILELLESARTKVHKAVSDDFDTIKAMETVTNLMHTVNKILKDKSRDDLYVGGNLASIAAASSFVRNTLTSFGFKFSSEEQMQVSNISSIEDTKIIVDSAVTFRSAVREIAKMWHLKGKNQDSLSSDDVKMMYHSLLKSCDILRDDFRTAGIVIKDYDQKSSWSLDDSRIKEKMKEEK